MTTNSHFDARVAARRKEVAAQEGQRRNGRKIVAIIAGVLAVLLIAGAVLYMAPVFTVREYKVTGNNIATVEEIQEAAQVPEGANLLHVDTNAAARSVAKVPWVQSVTVDRALPSTLSIEVTEREVVAFVKSRDGDRLIDSHGNEFVIAAPPKGAVEIAGLDGDAAKGEKQRASAVAILAAVSEKVRAKVDRLEVEGDYKYVFHLKDGRSVVWGANDNNEAKAAAMDTVLKMRGKDWNITNPEMVTKK